MILDDSTPVQLPWLLALSLNTNVPFGLSAKAAGADMAATMRTPPERDCDLAPYLHLPSICRLARQTEVSPLASRTQGDQSLDFGSPDLAAFVTTL